MKKFLLSLLTVAAGIFTASAETIDLAFTNKALYGEKCDWNNSYTKRVLTTDDYTVTLSSASKQIVTVTDVPVIKASDIILEMTNGATLSSVTVNFKQWSSKSNTATISYSTDGTNWTTINGASITDWAITTGDLPDGVKAVKATTSKTDQIGVTSIEYTITGEQQGKRKAGLAFGETSYSVTLGDSFESPRPTNPNNLPILYNSSDKTVATVAADGKVTILAAGKTTVSAISEETDEFYAGEASYTLNVIDPNAIGYEDLIKPSDFNISGSSYQMYAYTSSYTQVSYSVKASESKNNLQINTTGSTNAKGSAIVSTANPLGLVIEKIVLKITSASDATKVTLKASNSAGTATSAGTTGTNAVITEPENAEVIPANVSDKELTFTPNKDFQYFYVTFDGVTYVTNIDVYYKSTSSEQPEEAEIVMFEAEDPTSEGNTIELKYTIHVKNHTEGNSYTVRIVLNDAEGNEVNARETTVTDHTLVPEEAAAAPRRMSPMHQDANARLTGVAFIEVPEDITYSKGKVEYGVTGSDKIKNEEFLLASPITTSIAEIEAEGDGSVEWFDLSGRRVAEPTKGVFIMKKGSKVSKYAF